MCIRDRASREDLNAYFDRVVSPTQLVEKNFGERLHLQSAYEKYQLPEGVDPKGVRVAKDHSDNKWKVSMDLGDKGKTASMNSPSMTATRFSRQRQPPGNRLQPSTSIRKFPGCFQL